MNGFAIKEYYNPQELADLKLNCLPNMPHNIRAKAKKENWVGRKRQGKGGGLEYAFDSLPKAVQDEITAKHLMAQVKGNAPTQRVSRTEKALIASERDVATLTDKDRTTADCRLLMALLVSRYALEQNLPKTRAIKLVSEMSRAGKLPTLDGTDYNQICTQAVAPTGQAVKVGVIDYSTGVVILDETVNSSLVVQSLTTSVNAPRTDGVSFITPSAPIRPSSLTISATTLDGQKITATANAKGEFDSEYISGLVDVEYGLASVKFGKWVQAQGNEGEDWYNANAVVDGQIFKPL